MSIEKIEIFKTFNDYTIKFPLDKEDAASMEFVAKKRTGWSLNEETKEWTIPLYGDNSTMFSDDWGTAEEDFHGFIKWDGCSHWWFDFQHLCGRKDAKEFADVIMGIFDTAERLIPRYNVEVANK